MLIGIFDTILLIILAGFVFYGLFFGLIRAVGSLAGVIAGAWLASIFYIDAFELAENLFFGYDTLGRAVTFIVLFTIINRLVCFGFSLLDKTYNIISIIPFLKTINRLGGAVFGFLEGGIVVGLALYIAANNFFVGGLISKLLEGSKIAPFLLGFIDALKPLLPGMLEKLKELM
ncbi:CvpA family protein [Patescibacteria group bacterium]|nr:CvpA family protein [Candidatus Falkowbacteria bacterium]MBU3906451.1 CvpA family protein [Patescibacteria group bacterium]MBU4014739.1 CvpA family protein [Patescibacteria group bacterium]MBU4027087.1 CvpA family protein [Patescibacteria group bacterium]MBU4073630.1 CvpA family protein [Patescibacteria group bacterium]